MSIHTRILAALALALCIAPTSGAEQTGKQLSAPKRTEALKLALERLREQQNTDGSWGKRHTYAVTGLACLAYLAAADEPFDPQRGPHAKALTRGIEYLLAQQKAGMFPKQGHTWIHGQGFATLALSEAYGRSLLCTRKPDLDLKRLRRVVQQAAIAITQHQSTSGGWWYTPGSPAQHEGSTTVFAVQALVSAANYGLQVDEKALERGFEYLKKCQNPDGGFDYKLGPGTVSMKEGTAAGVATLSLMKKFDYGVMIDGMKFLNTIGHDAISKERFPYYGHFYGCMGMKLFGEEMAAQEKTGAYIAAVHATLLGWQQRNGEWPQRGWMIQNGGEDGAYSTAFASLCLAIPDARLSIFNRQPPTLPESDSGEENG